MDVRRAVQLSVLVAFAVMSPMALAQEQGEQQPTPTTDHGQHHGQTGQQTGQQMMGPSMMQGSMGPSMSAMFESRVTPMMNLSVEDVRGYLAVQLDRLNDKRLKVGDVKSDDGSITADIVTVDNSLVQRLKVDRHTGTIEYQN
jgi:hypothetical protein